MTLEVDMTETRRRYTKGQKVVAILAAEASNTRAAADQTGIPESTIRYWLDDPKFAELRAKSQDERSEGFRVLAHLAVERLTRLVPSMTPHDLIILMGVATEKAQLLSGEPTARTENKSITDGLDDHERQALNDAILGELGRRSDARSVELAVAAPVESGPEAT